MMEDRDERIRRRAHEIWEQEGRPHGRDGEHWQRARVEIEGAPGVSWAEAAQMASLRGSSSDPTRDSAAPGQKRRAPASPSAAEGEMSAKVKKPRNTPAKAASSRERSGSLASTTSKRQGNMPSELGGQRGEHSEASSSVKYRHPENPDLTWSGRGRRPGWIRDAVEAGRTLSDFEIGA